MVLGALAAGCAPTTTYRYTAYTPAVRPIAWDGRTDPAGSVRVEGTATYSEIAPNLTPQVHDTALNVPAWTLEGSAMIAISRNVELGVRAAYANYSWSQASAVGTMPLPNAPPSWGVGPELRMAFPLDHERRFALGLAASILDYQVPYAEWQLSGSCAPSPTCVSGYSLFDTRSESDLVYSFGVYPSYALGDEGRYGHVFALLGAATGFKNDGFTDTPTNGSTVESTGPVWMVGAGYGVSAGAGRFGVLVDKPLTGAGSSVDYGFGFQLTAGVDFDLLGDGRKDDPGDGRRDDRADD